MRKALTIIFFVFAIHFANSQGYRFTLNSSNLHFSKFDEKAILFKGISWDFTFLLDKFGVNAGTAYYFNEKYYGPVRIYGINNETIKLIRVNAEGSVFTFNIGACYDVFSPYSEKYKLVATTNMFAFFHSGKYNTEPFVLSGRGASDINADFVGLRTGLSFICKIGYYPILLSYYRNTRLSKMEYANFKVPGCNEICIGFVFPVIKSAPPSDIIKIEY